MGQSIGVSGNGLGLQAAIHMQETHTLYATQRSKKEGVGTFQDPWARMRNVVSNYP